MILYYTASKKTKVFAEALHEITGLPLQELESPLNDKKGFGFIIRALYLALTGKGYPVTNMPAPGGIESGEIYVCSPVWGGQLAGPAWFFLNNMDLKDKKVNLLLTCSNPNNGRYRKKAEETLTLVDCVPGAVYIMVTTKSMPEKDVALEHLREMLHT